MPCEVPLVAPAHLNLYLSCPVAILQPRFPPFPRFPRTIAPCSPPLVAASSRLVRRLGLGDHLCKDRDRSSAKAAKE
jgi:hypothetical protein